MVKMKRYSYGESRVFDCKDTRESEGFRSTLDPPVFNEREEGGGGAS